MDERRVLAKGGGAGLGRGGGAGAGAQAGGGGGGGGGGAAAGGSRGQGGGANQAGGGGATVAAAFDTFSDRKTPGAESFFGGSSPSCGGSSGEGPFQNIRITADAANNSIVIYSNQEDYRTIERALHSIDRPQLQVAIDATIAEISLTDALQYGVRFFFSSKDVGLNSNKGSAALLDSSAIVSRVLPGFNLLLGQEAQPRVVLDALSSFTNVKVLSSPSLVVVDNQPAMLQVGDEIPVTTRTATLIDNPNAPVVNNVELRSTGVILKVLPRVRANGSIDLEIEQEISNVANPGASLTPTISQRRVRSTISVMSGQTVLLGGLISEREENGKSGIPGLRDIKFLGDLFGTTSGNKQRTELIIFIRPQLIRDSLDARQVAEEFRDKLNTMRTQRPGADYTPITSKY